MHGQKISNFVSYVKSLMSRLVPYNYQNEVTDVALTLKKDYVIRAVHVLIINSTTDKCT